MAGKCMKLLAAIFYASMVIIQGGADDIAQDLNNAEDPDVTTFRKLFIQKRIIHLGAIKQLKDLGHDKRKKMLTSMSQKMFEVLSSSRITLEASGIAQAVDDLPKDIKVRDALALVLENTCLASEILLNFPNYMHKFLKEKRDSDALFRWCLSFSHGLISASLVDEHTSKLYKLALMELGVLPKDDGYHNPYLHEDTKPIKKFDFVDAPQPKKKVKKKLARGPRLTKSEL